MGLPLDCAYALGLTLTSPLWGCRMLRSGKHRTDWKARFGHHSLTPQQRPTLLLHAVSVGEVNALRLLVAQLAQACPDWRLVISSTTDTGYARARECFTPAHDVVRFPYDFTRAMARLLDGVRPHLVALAELEVWPNCLQLCTQRNIPVCVVNGRLSERSFRGYRRFRPFIAPMFRQLAQVAAQSPAIAERFIALGVPGERVQMLDNMKWDTAQVADRVDGAEQLASELGLDRSKPIIVAGSTGPGEEALLLEACPRDVQLVLVPRKPERFAEVAALDPALHRRTAGKPAPTGTTRFLLDTMGELRKAYALADVVIVGRSFLGLYGSDMLEPIALGKPTLIGPHYSDFAFAMDALVPADGIRVTTEPGPAAAALLADRAAAAQLAQRGRAVILSRQGATARHVALLQQLMPPMKHDE